MSLKGSMTLDVEAEVDEVADEVQADQPSEELEAEESQEGDAEAESKEEGEPEGAEEGVTISLGDEPADDEDSADSTEAFRNLRNRVRELARRNRELERQQKARPAAPVVDEVGPEPTLEGSNFDPEVYRENLLKWHGKQIRAEQQKAQREEAERKANEAYQKKLDAYRLASQALKVEDFEDAESTVRDVFNPMQQAILVKHTSQPAAFVYALGKSEAKAKELAAITDPIEFALKAAQLERDHLKVTPRKMAPPPDRPLRGSGSSASSAAANLQKLKEKAQATGDYTAYLAAKRAMKT